VLAVCYSNERGFGVTRAVGKCGGYFILMCGGGDEMHAQVTVKERKFARRELVLFVFYD
jgi:hypothetical protein